MKNKIVLLGMMGSGKSTVANILKEKTTLNLYESDLIFEHENNCLIKDFFSQYGEDEFRKKETEILKNVLENDSFILSTGGGIILSKQNRDLIFQKDILSIYLKTSPDVIFERLKNDKTRPLLSGENKQEKIEEILSQRDLFYSLSSVIINTDYLTPEKIADEIMKIG